MFANEYKRRYPELYWGWKESCESKGIPMPTNFPPPYPDDDEQVETMDRIDRVSLAKEIMLAAVLHGGIMQPSAEALARRSLSQADEFIRQSKESESNDNAG